MAQRRDHNPRRAQVQIEETRLTEANGDITLTVFARVSLGDRPLVGENVIVYTNRVAWEPAQTDNIGRISGTYEKLRSRSVLGPGVNQLLVEVCHTDPASGVLSKDQRNLTIKAGNTTKVGDPVRGKNEKPVPKSLVAIKKSAQLDASGKPTVMRHTVRLLVRDQFSRGVGNIALTYPDGTGGENIAVTSDKTGECGWAECTVVTSDHSGLNFHAEAKAEALVSNEVRLEGPPEHRVVKLHASSDRGQNISPDTMQYVITLWVLDNTNNPVGGKLPTWNIGNGEQVVVNPTAADTGTVNHTVDVVGFDAVVQYQAFVTTDGAASNIITLKGPEKKVVKLADCLIADVSICPNQDGNFLVTVITKCGNDPVQSEFTLHSTSAMKAVSLTGTTLGSGSLVSLQTTDKGSLSFLLGFDSPVQAMVIFNLANQKGEPTEKLLVKP
jgi:hypothetical protein